MKTHIYKLIAILLVVTLSFISCDIDSYELEGVATKETITQSESAARSTLAGIYESIRPTTDKGIIATMLSLTVSGIEQEPIGNNYKPFFDNAVKPTPADRPEQGLSGFYQKSYSAINLATLFITTIEANGINKTPKEAQNQILAEAKALRAHAYFHVLRVFGQFYNPESEYGVITTTKFIGSNTYLKRSKVSETYDLMIKDLEFALQYISPNNTRDLITKTYIKGLLAKIYLYKGGKENWLKTFAYCKDIIDNSGGKFELESTYSGIFTNGFESKELIFSPYYNKEKTQLLGNAIPIEDRVIKPAKYFKDLADPFAEDVIERVEVKDEYGYPTGEYKDSLVVKYGPRYDFTFVKKLPKKIKTSFSYNKYPTSSSPYHFLRVAEVYLMYAEAIVRTDGDMQEALRALNVIRKRAFFNPDNPSIEAPLVSFTDKATLLEDIRKEKMLELHLENAQSWFDLVRYHVLGDLDATKLKPSIKNVNQLIFPIPGRALRNNSKFGPQNPGY